ncbi:MAG: class I SAM-dependent methyltransferase [Deltaproteobacteria bacterium]
MDLEHVEKAYARWAPFYDWTFGAALTSARRQAMDYINATAGTALEIGIGTGLTLPLYAPSVIVTGVDYSGEMLARARDRVTMLGLKNVAALEQMDARAMRFSDASFDTIIAMHVLSVIPSPEAAMSEIARILKPGGQVVILGHFGAQGRGLMRIFNRAIRPIAPRLGWHSDFDRATILQEPTLTLERERSLPPFEMMSLLVLRKVV